MVTTDIAKIPTRISTISKTTGITVLTLQKQTAAPRVVISDSIDVSTKMSMSFFIRLGRQTETAFTASVNVRVEASPDVSGDTWIPTSLSFSSALGSSVASQAVNGTCTAGQAVVAMADTTGFAVGDIVFIENTTLANSEFGRVAAVSTNVSITLERNLVNAQTGSTVYDQAELVQGTVNCESYSRLQVVVDGAGGAQNFVIEVKASSGDGVS